MTTVDTDHGMLSPQILTPDTDNQHVDRPMAQLNGKEDVVSGKDNVDHHTPPISLLTALLNQTSEHRPPRSARQHASSSGITSPHSSAPSTAFSSPRGVQGGILQQSYVSDSHSARAQRRHSSSTESEPTHDGVVGLGFGGFDSANALERVEEKRERIEWADKVEQTSTAIRDTPASGLKFVMAQRDPDLHPRTRPFIRTHGAGLHQSGNGLPSKDEYPMVDEDEEDTDEGYQEDEEDGFDTDSSGGEDDDLRYPFARPTNFDTKRFIGSTLIPVASPKPAPSLLPPPSRRGRGHVRVNDPTASPTDGNKSCSRHRSPPPTPSRASSDASSSEHSKGREKWTNRLSDAGPRNGRAGSPMPRRRSADLEDEEGTDNLLEEEAADSNSAPVDVKGWRSDDAVFYGPKARHVIPLISSLEQRRRSAGHAQPAPVFVDTDEEEDAEDLEGKDAGHSGIRGVLRRTSEQIAGFARPAIPSPRESSREGQRCGRPSFSVPLPSQALCPPALDDTPAMAQNMTVVDYGDSSGPLAHRLEATLGNQVGSV